MKHSPSFLILTLAFPINFAKVKALNLKISAASLNYLCLVSLDDRLFSPIVHEYHRVLDIFSYCRGLLLGQSCV